MIVIEVSVSLYAVLSKYIRTLITNNKMAFVVRDNCTVRDLMDIVGIPSDEVGMVVINGRVVNNDYCLHENDEVKMFSPLEGG